MFSSPFTDWGAYPNGTITGGAGVAAWEPNRLDIFATDSNNSVAHRWYDTGSSGWDTWSGSGVALSGRSTTAIAMGDQRLFLSIAAANGHQYTATWDWGYFLWQDTGAYAVGADGTGMSTW